MTEANKTYDIIIVGTGMAGLASAIYAKRFGMETLVIGELQGGTITQTHLVENYPGYKSISGFELGMKFIEHAASVESEIKSTKVTNITHTKAGIFEVETAKGEKLLTYSVLLATGLAHRKLGVPGEAKYTNKGVSYCATCDGPLFRGKKVIVVGGGDSAFKESLFLAEHAEHVTIMYRRGEENLRPEPINAQRVEAHPKIDLMLNTVIKEIKGDENVITELLIEDALTSETSTFEAQGVFVEIGGEARSALGIDLGCNLDGRKQIIIDRYSRSSVPGVFAAGDVTDSEWKQGVICAAEGAAAAYAAYGYVNKKKLEN
ncbi:FAD-dependent oxidoreductase [Candidatus Peregrinibacteria bacterium]|jgi:thioredoxin reductase (NADPH)|nr:FAD-dependent oxidoreductase [Candidatus Peregrinibacteria bacterium]